MPTINGRACVVNGTPVDKVFSNGQQVYGRNYLVNSSNFSHTDPWVGNSGGTISVQDGCLSLFQNNTTLFRGVAQVFNLSPNDLGKKFTATTVVKIASDSTAKNLSVLMHFIGNGGDWDILYQAMLDRPDLTLSSDFQTFEFNGAIPNDSRIVKARLILFTPDNEGVYHALHKSLKFETGDFATPWTPAPEDVLK